MYLGEVKKRVELTATITGVFHYYGTPQYYGDPAQHTIYVMTDADDNQIKWDTTSGMYFKSKSGEYTECKKDDVIRFKATVKEHKEYKGTPQTVVNRLTVQEILVNGAEIKKENAKKVQMDSIKDGDVIYRMTYGNFKKHYADCETVIDSYDDHDRPATIAVIIREGRLKPSGTRFQTYSGYEYKDKITGGITCYRAVCEENAFKRCMKDHPDWTPELNHIYDYRTDRWF